MAVSFQSSNLAQPAAGSFNISQTLDFTAATLLALDLTNEVIDGKLDFFQSIYIDNADNSSVTDIIISGGPIAQRIRAQAFSQGWYPVTYPTGALRLTAASQGGIKVNVILSNNAYPYIVWGPASGVTVVPPLVNVAFQPLAIGAGSIAQLVAGVAAQSVKMYRGIFEVDQPTVLTWQDGNGGTTLFTSLLTAGGSVFFQPSGINWFNTSAGNGLFLKSSAAINLYGGFGYVQS